MRAGALSVLRPQVDLCAFNALPSPDTSQRVIGAFGRLEPQKGFDVLIDAFRQCTLPEARLVIFGEGSERDHLEGLARGDARISFRGRCSDMPLAYSEVNVVAMPSRWEAFGLVAQEAQAAGRTVLASDIDGLSEQKSALIHLQSGLSAQTWSQRLQYLLTHQPHNADRTSAGPAQNNPAKLAQDWMELFENPLASREVFGTEATTAQSPAFI